jgi:hypothetical protein
MPTPVPPDPSSPAEASAPSPGSEEITAPPLDVIACDGCGRRFATSDGPRMIAAIKGPCPECGGDFQLLAAVAVDPPL